MPRLWCNVAIVPSILAKTSQAGSSWVWVGVAAVIAVVWFALSRWNGGRIGDKGGRGSARGLFAQLAAAHQLNRAERGLLYEAASLRNLRNPAMVFVDPRVLRDLGRSKDAKAAEFAALAQRLFG
jgi:hypothetical protein